MILQARKPEGYSHVPQDQDQEDRMITPLLTGQLVSDLSIPTQVLDYTFPMSNFLYTFVHFWLSFHLGKCSGHSRK